MHDIRLGQLALDQSLAKDMWDYASNLSTWIANLHAKANDYRSGFRVLHDTYTRIQRPERAWSEFLFRVRISNYAARVRSELTKVKGPVTDDTIEALIDADIVAALKKPPIATLTAEDARLIQNNEWNRVKAPRPPPTSPPRPAVEAPPRPRPVFRSPRSSFQWLELAADQHPSAKMLSTLGIAYYRRGEFDKAIATLLRSLAMNKTGEDMANTDPSGNAFLALSYLKLGNQTEADKYRTAFDAAMKLDKYKNDDDNQRFQKELEEAFAK